VALLAVLLRASLPSIRTFGARFVTDSTWRPNELTHNKRDAQGKLVRDEDGQNVVEIDPPRFGALPVIYGTVLSSVLSLFFAVPLSIGTALFLVRIAPRVSLHLMAVVSFLVEFLAAIPSIAYGIWGVFVLVPLLGMNMLCGGLILGIMILPIITSISRDVLKAVPRVQIEGTQALGATWWQSSVQMLRYSRAGLFGAIMLGLARASGETMAVAMVIGNVPQIKASLLFPAQTMSSLLANEFAEANTPLHVAALSEVALILLMMSLLFNVVARYLVVGKQVQTA